MKIFVSKTDINKDKITISKEDSHHLEKVLRVRSGDRVIACDGQYNYECELDNGDLRIIEKSVCRSENKLRITIFQAVPKSSKMETIIQMCSELGVNRIIPMRAEFCVADLPDGKKLNRWRKIALESAKQCGRDRVLEVYEGVGFDRAVEVAKSECDLAFVCWENEKETRLRDIVGTTLCGCPRADAQVRPYEKIGIFIGSEGGFSQEEIARAGLPVVTLGKRILRTQTVAPVVSAMVLNILGEI